MICGFVSTLFVVTAFVVTSMRFASEMQIVGSCSAAIAVACDGVLGESRREEGAFKGRLIWELWKRAKKTKML